MCDGVVSSLDEAFATVVEEDNDDGSIEVEDVDNVLRVVFEGGMFFDNELFKEASESALTGTEFAAAAAGC